jgi:mediator of RNA polymerase II transcription subunit 5
MYRSEPTESLTLLRSYLVNKLPVFLLNYASMIFEPMTVEYCISQALTHVDPTAFPSFSQMFDILGRNSVSEARQEFLFACALHQLIPEQNIEGLLGDVPMQSLPAGGRCTKHDLVAQCTANPSRIEELVVELENMEGNAGEIASALLEVRYQRRVIQKRCYRTVTFEGLNRSHHCNEESSMLTLGFNQIMQTLCTNNDTMTLKGLCNALSRRLGALDVIMLFSTPEYLLRPLCNTLDNWQIHEDQGLPILLNLSVFTADKSKGENQPVYDEFGSILLFVMLVNYRFDLQRHDLGVSDSSSFILHYVRVASAAKNFDELTEKESKLLGAWVRGLFEENEGINDELMAASSPIEFHLVVATLLDQSLKACQAGFLPMSTLKDGLECKPECLQRLTALPFC